MISAVSLFSIETIVFFFGFASQGRRALPEKSWSQILWASVLFPRVKQAWMCAMGCGELFSPLDRAKLVYYYSSCVSNYCESQLLRWKPNCVFRFSITAHSTRRRATPAGRELSSSRRKSVQLLTNWNVCNCEASCSFLLGTLTDP